MRDLRTDRGYSLLELLICTAVMSWVMVSVPSLAQDRSRKSVQEFGEVLVSNLDLARQRAIGSRRTQQVEFKQNRLVHLQADREGRSPNEFLQLDSKSLSRSVTVQLFFDGEDQARSLGSFEFAADGTAPVSGTIYLSSRTEKMRIVIHPATGVAELLAGW